MGLPSWQRRYSDGIIKAWYQRGVQVAQLTISTHHPLWPQAQVLVSEDQTSHSDIWVRIQDRDRFVQHIRPQLEERARAADLKLTICFTEDGNVLEFGHGKPVALRLTASDLCALVYNGRRLLGLLTEGGIIATPDDLQVLALLFPDTGTARCTQDVY